MLSSRLHVFRGHLLKTILVRGPSSNSNTLGTVKEQVGLPALNSLSKVLTRSYLSVGYKADSLHTFTEKDVQVFAGLTNDLNPLHTDEEYASTTRFRKPIIHGVLQVGLIAGVVGTKLPGPGTVAVNYEIKHPYPLYVGEEVRAEVEVIEVDRRRITLKMTCTTVISDKITTEGTIKVLAPKELVK